MKQEFNAKITENYYNQDLRGRVFVMSAYNGCKIIRYSVGEDGLQKKTKFQNKIIPEMFFERV